MRILRVEATWLLFFSREQVRDKTLSSPAWVALLAPEAHDGSEFEELTKANPQTLRRLMRARPWTRRTHFNISASLGGSSRPVS